MLCLTRQIGQSVILAGNIKVTVLAINGSNIKLGFQAPKEITIDRQEVHTRKAGKAA
jgi:carbon storage regulator